MLFTIDQAPLAKALAVIARTVERRNTVPIVACVLIEAGDAGLVLTGTDLDIEMRLTLPAEASRSGACAVAAQTLADIVRKLSGQVRLELGEDGRLVVRSGRSRFTLPTLDRNDFPTLSRESGGVSIGVPGKAMAAALERVSFAISTEETRYYLNGVHLHRPSEGGEIVAVATDGHRLSKIVLPVTAPDGFPAVIVPRKTCAEIARMAEAAGAGDLSLTLSPGRIIVELEGEGLPSMCLASKLIDGSFPDYTRVIPRGNPRRVVGDIAAIRGAVERIATIAGERGRAVKLELGSNAITLSMTNPEAGSAVEEVEVEYDGDPLIIGFNARYLIDVLDSIPSHGFAAAFGDAGSPCLLTSAVAGDGGELVLMPMRV